jgi:hypothetical protein
MASHSFGPCAFPICEGGFGGPYDVPTTQSEIVSVQEEERPLAAEVVASESEADVTSGASANVEVHE